MGVVWRTALDGCGLEDRFRWVWSGCGTPDRRCFSASWRGVALGCGLGGRTPKGCQAGDMWFELGVVGCCASPSHDIMTLFP